MKEFVKTYKKRLTIALIIAVAFHIALIGIYYTAHAVVNEEPLVIVRLIKYTDLPAPPRIAPSEATNIASTIANIVKPNVGIPVPIPDAEANAEQTFATQKDLSELQNPIQQQIGDGQIKIEDNLQIEDEPLDFVPVEKQPVSVSKTDPIYPEIARRASVEGTVWIKMLITKEGKVKKAVVAKSDADIFNDAAITAALQWVFTPAIMNNGPVSVWAIIPFKFKINR